MIKKAKAATISKGDQVLLVKDLQFDGKHKIAADKFEEDMYDVIDQPRDQNFLSVIELY